MSFASRLIPRSGNAVRGYFLVALGVLALGLGGGCEDKHIGRPCNTNVADAGASGGQVAILTSPSLECPSRICLQPAPGGTGFGRRSAGRRRGDVHARPARRTTTAPTAIPARCARSDFVCTWPTTTGSFCCQKMCVCHDFVVVPTGGIPEPSTCLSPSSRRAEPADLPERPVSDSALSGRRRPTRRSGAELERVRDVDDIREGGRPPGTSPPRRRSDTPRLKGSRPPGRGALPG